MWNVFKELAKGVLIVIFVAVIGDALLPGHDFTNTVIAMILWAFDRVMNGFFVVLGSGFIIAYRAICIGLHQLGPQSMNMLAWFIVLIVLWKVAKAKKWI